MAGGPSKSNWSLRDDPETCRPEGHVAGVTTQTVVTLCRNGYLAEAVEALGVLVVTQCFVSTSLLYAVLNTCAAGKDLVLGRRVHAFTVKLGYQSNTFLCNLILRMYASHGRLQDAMDVFTMVPEPDAFMWSSIISSHVKLGLDKQALQLYERMRTTNVRPDGHVFVAALQACAKGGDLRTGRWLHAHLSSSGLECDLFVCNCLVDMYAKCDSLADARKVFDGLSHKDVVTWTAMIGGYSRKGMGKEALCLYSVMQEEGSAVPNSVTYVCLLQACASVGVSALNDGKQLHAQIRERGCQGDVSVGNSLVNMYAKCGSLADAQTVFDTLGQKDTVTWNAMLAGYSQQGLGHEALRLHVAMQNEGIVVPDSVTFVCLLQACASVGTEALEKGRQLYEQIIEQGHETDVKIANSLVNMYAKCGSLDDAQTVFDSLAQRDVVTWTALIAGYSQQGMGQEALRVYTAMHNEGILVPNSVTFVCLLQACASVGGGALEKGKQLEMQLRERGYQDDVFVANSLVNMYAKCGSLEDAMRVFDGLRQKDVVTWNAMIAGYSQQGMGLEALRLYSVMEEEGTVAPNAVTFVCLLQVCASMGIPALEKGKLLHAQICEQGHQAGGFLGGSLVNMYAKCGSLEDAQNVFQGLSQKDVVTWNALITGYALQSMGQEALRLYSAMQDEGITVPDSVTFVCVLQACASIGTSALAKGKLLHTQISEQGHQADVAVANSLVNMYAKCGSVEDAERVFDGVVSKDVVTWNAMIALYSQRGLGEEALRLYTDMRQDAVVAPDSVTFARLLQACSSVGTSALEQGKQLHAQIRERGREGDPFVSSSLVSMYAKCGSFEDAQRVFDGLGFKDVATWNAMMAGFILQGLGQEAIHLFSVMQADGSAQPDCATFVSLLQACASIGIPALEKGKELHVHIRERGHDEDVVVANSLVNMYAKCGSLEDAQLVFDRLGRKDVVTWNTMIAGYSHKGMGQVVLNLYRDMQADGMAVPDSVTFVCLLQACGNLAALHLGRQLHSEIENQGLHADAFVASSLMNMYGKCGSMVDAQEVFDALAKRDVVAWSALVAGYTRQGDSEAVCDLVQRMLEDGIQPDAVTFLSVLTVCSHAGLVNKGEEYFEAMSKQFGITPTVEHYTCMVDLLGRAGQLDEALCLARSIPALPGAAVWHTLLGSCQKWSNVEVGCHAFNEAVKLDAKDAAAYLLMSNIYSSAQMWEQAEEMQTRRKRISAWKRPGQSWWTDMAGVVHAFAVRDKTGIPRVEQGCEI